MWRSGRVVAVQLEEDCSESQLMKAMGLPTSFSQSKRVCSKSSKSVRKREVIKCNGDSVTANVNPAAMEHNTTSLSSHFEVGDRVWYYVPRRRQGSYYKWMKLYQGPYEITELLGAINARIRRSPRAQPIIVHLDKLKKLVDYPSEDQDQDREHRDVAVILMNM